MSAQPHSDPVDVPDEYPPAADEREEDLDDIDSPLTDEAAWDVFIPDDDECDPAPDPGDFWTDDEASDG